MKIKTCFRELYSFPGFRAKSRFKSGIQGDPNARVVALVRRQKKRCVRSAGSLRVVTTTKRSNGFEMSTPGKHGFIWTLSTGDCIARRARV